MLLLAVVATAASVQDSTAGRDVPDHLAVTHPEVSSAWVDGGCKDEVVRHGVRLGIRVEVVKRIAATGFHVLPRRWVVERTPGWLMQHRRLVRGDRRSGYSFVAPHRGDLDFELETSFTITAAGNGECVIPVAVATEGALPA
nr:hypothetical protein [Saccharothrix deserti]